MWEGIEVDTDIVVTHGPVRNIGDFIPSTRECVGCEDLLARLEIVKPKVCIFGHIHEGYGVYPSEHTIYINASICDANYTPTNKPHVIEL